MPDIAIRLIKPDEGALIDSAYALYAQAIEKTEQRPEADFRALAARDEYRFVAALMDGQLAGIAVSWAPRNADFWLFEYVAVAPDMREKGAGANLFFATRYAIGQQRVALVEVDAFMGLPDQARRLSFYGRLGCRRLAGLDYLLPLDAFGKPPPMWLLALPPQAVEGFSVFTVEDWLRRIYCEAYGKAPDDPRLARMIDPLPDVVALEALSPDRATP